MHKAGDFGLGGPEVFDGVVCAVVAELELVGVCAESDREELMAEADAEDGQGAEEVPYGIDCVFDGCGCVATECSSVRAFSGKAAAVAAGKDTRAIGAKVTR